MLVWSNYHTHNNFCDGKSESVNYVTKALELNMNSLGFSSHAPLPFDCKWCMKPEAFTEYLKLISSLKDDTNGLEIYTGLEVDYIPGVISPGTFRKQLDYTIGSVHFVETMSNGIRWEIDGLHSFFLEGLEDIFKNNIKDAITRYYELTRQMITTDCPSIVGHLDKIKIQNIDDRFFNEDDDWYKSEIIKTLNCIEDAGTILEVNTRGLYQKKSKTTYPSPWILEIASSKNIPITLSSDAHHHDDVTNQFSEAAYMLSSLGFKKLSILKEGQWQQFKFNEQGLIITGR